MLKILKIDFKPLNLLTPILINILFTFLMFLFLYLGYASNFINKELLQNQYFMFSNIIVVTMILFGLMTSMREYGKLLDNEALFINYKTAGIFENSIFWGKTLSIWFQILINSIIILFVLFVMSGLEITGLTFLYYFLFLMISSLLITSIAAIIKFIIRGRQTAETNVFYILILLLLCSGFFMPFSLMSGPIYYVIKYLPFSIIMEGSSKILSNNAFSLIESLYVSILTLTLLATNYLLYKKELRK